MTALTHDASAAIGERAFDAHRRIITLRNRLEQTFLELGEALYHFEREKLYLEFGHPSFNSYLADPEVGIKRTRAYMMKGIYKRYILELKLTGSVPELIQAGIEKLYRVRKYTTENNAAEVVLNAAALSESDLLAWLDGTEPLDDLDPDTVICPLCHGTGRVANARV